MKILTSIQFKVIVSCACAVTFAQSMDTLAQNENPVNASIGADKSQTATERKDGHKPPAQADKQATQSGTGSSSNRTASSSKPHIVMIVADDLGWNDVDWRDRSLYTPVISGLAREGMVLNQSYVQPVCSPSRGAFLSGFYPYHIGLQHDSLRATQKAYMPGNLTTLPQHLQRLGYKTHMAGKWHLGFCNWRYTPTFRGFDSFVGFYNAIQDYYTHIGHHNGYDFRLNQKVYYDANGTYSAFIFTKYIEKVIAKHDTSEPLFLYLPFQSVHGPLQVPQVYIDKYCSHIKDASRRTKCGMIAALDEGVGNVTRALQQRGIFNDTLLFFTTDNGGPVNEGANNWPLRGSKTTLWEGGTRALAFLHGPRFLGPQSRGTTYNGIIHAVDWLPTLVEAAGGKPDSNLDGVSQWQSLVNRAVPSARTEFVYNFDELKNNSALRQGKYKLLQGNPGKPDKWYPPPSLPKEFSLFRNVTGENPEVTTMTQEDDVTIPYQLYDLEADPTERHDVKDKYPDVFKRMRARLAEYRKSLVPANFPPHDPAALPSNFNGVWSPGWC